MATQIDLNKVWAVNGGTIDPDIALPGKYEDGWVVEIPTFENFNYVLKNLTNNLLAFAQHGQFDYEDGMTYYPGNVVYDSGVRWTCIRPALNQAPILGSVFWTAGSYFTSSNSIFPATAAQGVLMYAMNTRAGLNIWDGNDITIKSETPIISLVSTGVTDNWLVANISGEVCVVNEAAVSDPNGTTIALADANVFKVYHEGNKPVQADIVGTIPDSPSDGDMYARLNGTWIPVTTTTVSVEPPPPVVGNGAGWYNLMDGQLYIDINDGDSSQWVAPNPPLIAKINAIDIQYDNSTSGLLATTVQGAIDELAAMHP